MKKYECDGGTIMIGTRDSRVCLPNGYGDGCFKVFIIKTDEQRKKFIKQNGWDWLGTVNGECFYVYDYDCLRDDDLTDPAHILYTLHGTYGVYCSNGDITLEKWND